MVDQTASKMQEAAQGPRSREKQCHHLAVAMGRTQVSRLLKGPLGKVPENYS